MVLDRWRFLRNRLPHTRNGESLLEVGCGSGTFTIGAAARGYDALGLSWDGADLQKATDRAAMSGVADKTRFIERDARYLDQHDDLPGRFDVVICCETMEHILDDLRLMKSLYACLKPGGRLLLTAPNVDYRSVTPADDGPFDRTETGWHVRRGYSRAMLLELCDAAGFIPEEVSFCAGFTSQKISWVWRQLARINAHVAWLGILPLRALPILFDRILERLFGWPGYSICLTAYRPRFHVRPVVGNSIARRSEPSVVGVSESTPSEVP
jgi:SAM-dependent methyltransferase